MHQLQEIDYENIKYLGEKRKWIRKTMNGIIFR